MSWTNTDFVIEHIKRLGCHTMTDIVERLRFLKAEIEELVGQDIEEIEEAAMEIERLTALLTTSTALMERVDARAAFGQQWGDAIAANRAALKDAKP